MSVQVFNPFEIFHDINGRPVDDGFIWVGHPNLDAETNPISVFFDEALTIPAVQPIRTRNGYPSNAGVKAELYVSATMFSIKIENKNGTLISQNTLTNAKTVDLLDYAALVTDRPTPNDPGTWDWAPAANAAIQSVPAGEAVMVHAPAGVYGLKSPINWSGRRASFYGENFSSRFNVLAGFVGNSAFILGDSVNATPVAQCCLQGVRIDCGGGTVKGIEIWGIRDSSLLRDIHIGNFTGKAFESFTAGGSGLTDVNMSQGVLVENVHAISLLNLTQPLYDINSMFECTFINCKALGATGATSTCTGFRVGNAASTRGVAFIQCAVGGMLNAGTPSVQNAGIHYSSFAEECWDEFCTFESIQGNAVRFSGSVSGFPKLCQSIASRPYNNVPAERLNPCYLFGTNNNGCRVRSAGFYNTAKTFARFEGGFNSSVEYESGQSPDELLSTNHIEFIGGSEHYVQGYCRNATQSRRNYLLSSSTQGAVELPAGTVLESTVNFTTVTMSSGNQFRLRDSALVNKLTYIGGQFTMEAPLIAPLIASSAFNGVNPLRLGNFRIWFDAFSKPRFNNGAPASSQDGFPFGNKVAVPSTSTSAGAPGEWAADTSFFYVYTGDGTTHTWHRVAIATW